MRYIVKMKPTRKGFEIETKREVAPHDSVRILNSFSLLTDTIESGIKSAFSGMDGVDLHLAGETGLLKAMEESGRKNEECIGGEKC